MTVIVRPPSPALSPFVERLGYYSGEVPRGYEPALPTGTLHLLVNLAADRVCWYEGEDKAVAHTRRPAVLSVPSSAHFGVDLAEWHAVVFVCFRPGGAHPFVGPPAATIDEPLVELEELWGRDGAVLRDRLLEAPSVATALNLMEQALFEHSLRPLEPDPTVAWAVAALSRGASVSQTLDQLQVSHSTLLRRFTAHVGLTPKRFARIRRLQRLLAAVARSPEADWAAAASHVGFFDQAHLINEFRALTGMVPSEYRPRFADPHHPELLIC